MHWLDATAIEANVLEAARRSLLRRAPRLSFASPRIAVAAAFDRVDVGGSETDLIFSPPIPVRGAWAEASR